MSKAIDSTQTDDNEWNNAVETIRGEYDDSYSDRVTAAAEIHRSTDHNPKALGGEGVMGPLLRYQKMDPVDVFDQIVRKAGEDEAEQIRKAVIDYAATLE